MSVEIALEKASNKPTGKRPYFFAQDVERVLAITMAVVQELAVTRQRLDTVERLLEAKGLVSREAIESFAPNAEQGAERGLWTQEYIARVLRIVQQEGEALSAKADASMEDLAQAFADPHV